MGRMTAKGTRFEVQCLDILRPAFPAIERRAKLGINDMGDFVNLGWWELGEAKWRKAWDLGTWIRTVKAKVRSNRWFIIFTGDRRKPWVEEFVLLPASAFAEREAYIRELEERLSK